MKPVYLTAKTYLAIQDHFCLPLILMKEEKKAREEASCGNPMWLVRKLEN